MKKRTRKKKSGGQKIALMATGLPPWPERTRTNLLLLALFGIFLFRTVFLHPGQLMWANDIIRFTLAGRYAEWRSIWEMGSAPFWDPTIFSGMATVGDQARGITNPLTWLHWLLPAPALFGPFACFVTIFGAWGMFLFVRERGSNTLGAFFAAAAFAMSAKTAGHLFAGHLFLVSTVLGLPWMLYGVERVIKREDYGSTVIMALLFALAALQGAVQMFYWNVLFILAYGLIRLFCDRDDEKVNVRATLVRLAGGSTIGALLCAPWWLPVIRQTLLLGARTQDKTYDFAAMASAQAPDLLRHLWPFAGVPTPQPFLHDAQLGFFWETASYPGVVTIVLAFICLATNYKKRALMAIGVLGFVVLLVGLGPNTPLHKAAYYLVPGFSLFRAPARLFFYSNFVLALLAGIAIGQEKTSKQAGWLFGGVFVGLQLLLFATLGLNSSVLTPERGLWLPLILVAGLAIAAFLWAFRHVSERAWQYTCLGLLLAELVLVWSPHIHTAPQKQILPPDPTAAFLAEQRTSEPFRVLDTTGTLPQQIAAKYGIELVAGYHPGVYGHQLELYQRIWREDASSIIELERHRPGDIACPAILDLMNVKYIVTHDTLDGDRFQEVQQHPGNNGRPPVKTYRRVGYLPRAYVVAEAHVPPENSTVLDSLCDSPLQEYALVADTPHAGQATYQPLSAKEDRPGDVTFAFSSEKAGVVVLSESWHPDWRAYDGGNPLPVRRVNHGQLGVHIGPGTHQLRICYVPWDFYLGLAVSGLTALALLIVGVAQVARKSKRSGTAPPSSATAL